MTRPRQDPARRDIDLSKLDPVALGAQISQLPPGHKLVVAARSAAEVSVLRHEHKVAMRDASKDVAGGYQAPSGHRADTVNVRAEEKAHREQLGTWLIPQPRDASDRTASAVAKAVNACRVTGRRDEHQPAARAADSEGDSCARY